MWRSGTLAAGQMGAAPFELAVSPAREHNDLVLICVVRLDIDESAFLLAHVKLLSSPFDAATVPQDGRALHGATESGRKPAHVPRRGRVRWLRTRPPSRAHRRRRRR